MKYPIGFYFSSRIGKIKIAHKMFDHLVESMILALTNYLQVPHEMKKKVEEAKRKVMEDPLHGGAELERYTDAVSTAVQEVYRGIASFTRRLYYHYFPVAESLDDDLGKKVDLLQKMFKEAEPIALSLAEDVNGIVPMASNERDYDKMVEKVLAPRHKAQKLLEIFADYKRRLKEEGIPYHG
ncbi:MAG: hypothetical protein KJ574_00850 [Nanoarchaeota archaeon]|nr:hypothetical protein [Nanoarchaeota archaeon]